MSVYDLRDLAIFVLVTAASAVILSFLFCKFRPEWSRGRTALLAALPIPAIIWALCLILFLMAATSSAEECGVDACGMAIMSATYVGGYAALAYLVAAAAAWMVAGIVGR